MNMSIVPKVVASSLFCLVMLGTLEGCHKAPILLEKAIVRNASSRPISNVLVQHEPTGGMARVNKILPEAELYLGFSRQPMKAKWAMVTWKMENGERRQVKVNLPRSPGKPGTETFTLIYTIEANGAVSVRLER